MSVELSIVTITYNDPAGLKLTLDSLRPLTMGFGRSWEHVIVDSSPDANVALITSLKARGWPLKHVASPPKGIYPAQNEGMRAASGKYLWLLNGGDQLHDINALNDALDCLDRHPEVDICGLVAQLTRNGIFLYNVAPFADWMRSLAGFNRLCHQALVYRRSSLERVGPLNETLRLASDYEHHFRCYLSGLKLATLPGIIVSYDMSGRSNDFRPVFAEFRRVHREIGPRLPAWFRLANEALRPLEQARVGTLKSLAASPFAAALKPLWLAYKRKRG